MFPHFKSLSDFLFVNEVFSFTLRSSFDGFHLTAREIDNPGDTASTNSMDAMLLAVIAFLPTK